MNCTSCGRPVERMGLCQGCNEIAKTGTVVICTNCNQIARTFIYTEEVSIKKQRILYTPLCKNCDERIIDIFYMFTTEEKSKEEGLRKVIEQFTMNDDGVIN